MTILDFQESKIIIVTQPFSPSYHLRLYTKQLGEFCIMKLGTDTNKKYRADTDMLVVVADQRRAPAVTTFSYY